MANLSNINNILRTNSTGVGIFDDAVSYPLEISSATTAGMRLLNTAGATYDVYANASEEFLITKVGVGERLNIASGGAITFNNAYTFPTAIGTEDQVLQAPATGKQLVWGTDGGGTVTSIATTSPIEGGTITSTGTISHAAQADTETTSSETLAHDGTFTALTTVTTNATGHVTGHNLKTYTLPSGSTGTVKGTGTATRVAFWSVTDTISSDADLYWDNTNKRLGIGTIIPGGTLSVGSGLAKTSGSSSEVLYLGQSNEASNYFVLQGYTVGAAAAADRMIKFQTVETGVANAGRIVLQPSGGQVAIGSDGFSSQILSVNSGTSDEVFYGVSTDASCFASFRDNSSTANIEYGAIGNAHVFRKDTTEYMRITSGGQVGIGTPSPQDYDGESDDLVVAGGVNGTNPYIGMTIACLGNQAATGGKGAIRFADGTSGSERYIGGIEYQHAGDDMFFRTNGSLRMAIDSAGNVGIGTTDPSTLLNLEKSVDAFQALLIESTATYPAVSNAAGSKFTNSSGSLYMFVDNGGGDYGPTGGTGAASAYAGNFRLTGAYPLQFATSDTLRMTITAGGDVGIGTKTPNSYDGEANNLVVFDTTTPGITIATDTTTSRGSVLFADGTTGNEKYRGGVIYDHGTGMGGVADTMYLRAGVTGYLALNALGYVGILQKNPTTPLEVSGNIYSTTRVQAGNTLIGTVGSYATLGSNSASTAIAISRDWTPTSYPDIIVSTSGNTTIGGTSQYTGTGVKSFNIQATDYPLLAFYAGASLRGAIVAYSDHYAFTHANAAGYWRFSNNTATQGLLSGTGTLTVKGDVVAYGSPSDKRLKENIKPIESALDKVSKLQGVTFDWIQKEDAILDIKEDIGFIAQDVQKVIPELVRENEDGMLSMRHQGMAPILLEAIKELKQEIEELKSKPCNCNNCNCKK